MLWVLTVNFDKILAEIKLSQNQSISIVEDSDDVVCHFSIQTVHPAMFVGALAYPIVRAYQPHDPVRLAR